MFRSDNIAVVATLSSRFASDELLMQLLRCLFFLDTHFEFDHQAKHVARVTKMAANVLSDSLNFSLFAHSSATHSCSSPSNGSAGRQVTDMDIPVLEGLVGEFCMSNLAARTSSTYSSAVHHFLSSCHLYMTYLLFHSESILCLLVASWCQGASCRSQFPFIYLEFITWQFQLVTRLMAAHVFIMY